MGFIMAKPRKRKKMKNVEKLTTDEVMRGVFGKAGQKELLRSAERSVPKQPNRSPSDT